MRLARFLVDEHEKFGIVDGDQLANVTDAVSKAGGLRSLMASSATGAVETAVEGAKRYAIADVTFLPPVPNPEKILCVGVNFLGRNGEFNDGANTPDPSLFFRTPGSFTGHNVPLIRPAVTKEFDYEGEIALIIGKAGRKIAREDALDHVFGATLCNEGTVHDWLRKAKFNNTQGKNFDDTGSLGPYIVTADEINLDAPMQITTTVNGEMRQQDTTDRMLHGFRALIAYVSQFTTLQPGDIIVTGTPVGCGRWYDPPKWLVAGDVIEVTVPEIGTLRNTVADEPT